MIEAKDVSCTFARNPFSKEGFMAVSPVSIQFIDGERYAIVGESGSGKTCLLYTSTTGGSDGRTTEEDASGSGQADLGRVRKQTKYLSLIHI